MESGPKERRNLQELYNAVEEGTYQYDGQAFQIHKRGSRLEIYSSNGLHAEADLISNWILATGLSQFVSGENENHHPSNRELLDEFLQLLNL